MNVDGDYFVGFLAFDSAHSSTNNPYMKTIALLATLIAMTTIAAHAESIYDIKLKDIDGKDTTLAA